MDVALRVIPASADWMGARAKLTPARSSPMSPVPLSASRMSEAATRRA